MARISTHVLDTAHGRPAVGLRVGLYLVRDGERHPIKTAMTNSDGRTVEPLLSGDSIETGEYEIAFNVADYFRGAAVELPSPPFLDQVIIRFGVSDSHGDYHVPLLVSPYGYSTYRGS
jgi:5-hydroxyisourate hydrolase